MSLFYSMCPVPFDQQPINEYKSLRKLTIFSHSFVNSLSLISNFIFIAFSISLCFMLLTFKYCSKPQSIICFYSFLLATLIIEVILIRIYLGWSYISKRLLSASVIYEESGWYDVQIWIKSADSLIKDRLIGIYQVTPLVIKIKNITYIVSTILCFEILLIVFIN